MKLKNFKKLGKICGTSTNYAEFTLNGNTERIAFNPNTMNRQTLRIYEESGDLSNFTRLQLIAAIGKHSSHILRRAIEQIFNIDNELQVRQRVIDKFFANSKFYVRIGLNYNGSRYSSLYQVDENFYNKVEIGEGEILGTYLDKNFTLLFFSKSNKQTKMKKFVAAIKTVQTLARKM